MDQSLFTAPPDLLAGEQFPTAPQQERSRRKRAALLESALALFAERGFEDATIEQIAARAGVAAGGFYQHFTGKRQLLLALMDQLLREASALTQPSADLPTEPRAAIGALVRAGLQTDFAFAGAYRAWREAAARDAALRVLDAAINDWTANRLHALFLALLVFPGARPDLDVASFAGLMSTLFLRLIETPPADEAAFERTCATLTAMIYHTLFVG